MCTLCFHRRVVLPVIMEHQGALGHAWVVERGERDPHGGADGRVVVHGSCREVSESARLYGWGELLASGCIQYLLYVLMHRPQ